MTAKTIAIRAKTVLMTLALAAGMVLMVTVPSVAAENSLTDPEIWMAVDDRLIDDPATPAWEIDVSTNEGIVTLTGSVDNILAKERAEKLAATVKGVKGVVNRIDVSAPFRGDTEIQEDVKQALAWDAATASWEIVVSVEDQVATLEGTVDSWQEKQLAAKVAKGVDGVNEIQNLLEIDFPSARSDAEIKAEIQQALRWDAYVDDSLIDINVDNGTVTLSGTVASTAEQREAVSESWVAGVTQVENNLQTESWAREERFRQEKYKQMSDPEIKEAINDAFLYDPRVNTFEIDVDTYGGRVTLRGTVDNLKAKRAAGQDARSVVGVWSVDNRIKVRPATPSDATIKDRVEDALGWDPVVERYEIDISVVDGEVYLYGEVDSAFEKARADDVAARQAGVREVNNFLTFNEFNGMVYDPYVDDWHPYDYDWYGTTYKTTTKDDWEIKEDIQDELFWSPFVDSDEVNVAVDDATAILTGTVDSWNERQAATENALQGGAVMVDNDLTVRYGPEYYQP